MALVGAAQFLLEVIGMESATGQIDKFQKVASGGSRKLTDNMEKQAKTIGKTVGAFAALGAALPGIFGELIANSAVADSVFGGFMDVLGGFVDIALNALMPVLQPMLDLAVQFLTWFQTLPAPVQAVIGILIILVPAIIGVSIALTVLEAAGGPIILIILAIIAVILVVMYVWQHWGDIVHWFTEHIVNPLVGFFSPIVNFLRGILMPILTLLGGMFNWLGGVMMWWIEHVVLPMVGILGGVWNAVVSGFKWLVNQALGAAQFFGNLLISFVNMLLDGIAGFLNLFINGINYLIDGLNAVADKLKLPLIGHLGLVSFGHLAPLALPRLEAGGEIVQSGLAMVHKGEVYSGVGAAAVGGFGALNLTQHIYLDSTTAATAASAAATQNELVQLFKQLGELSGQRLAETVRRRT